MEGCDRKQRLIPLHGSLAPIGLGFALLVYCSFRLMIVKRIEVDGVWKRSIAVWKDDRRIGLRYEVFGNSYVTPYKPRPQVFKRTRVGDSVMVRVWDGKPNDAIVRMDDAE